MKLKQFTLALYSCLSFVRSFVASFVNSFLGSFVCFVCLFVRKRLFKESQQVPVVGWEGGSSTPLLGGSFKVHDFIAATPIPGASRSTEVDNQWAAGAPNR